MSANGYILPARRQGTREYQQSCQLTEGGLWIHEYMNHGWVHSLLITRPDLREWIEWMIEGGALDNTDMRGIVSRVAGIDPAGEESMIDVFIAREGHTDNTLTPQVESIYDAITEAGDLLGGETVVWTELTKTVARGKVVGSGDRVVIVDVTNAKAIEAMNATVWVMGE